MGATYLSSFTRLCHKGELPIRPWGERIALLPDEPAEESTAGIILPTVAQHKPNSGRLLAAGLIAMDKLWDHGIEIGDRVFWGKFAGCIEEWDHIVDGEFQCPNGEHSWERSAAKRKDVSAFRCMHCGATRLVEPLIIANVDDVFGSCEQEQRLIRGEIAIERRPDTEGRTCHVIVRKEK